MLLIADSGSTKTDWRLVHKDGRVEAFSTPGFNPFYSDSKALVSGIRLGLPPTVAPSSVKQVYFYGAGCSSGAKCAIVEQGLQIAFPSSVNEVHHDMLAAARALFQDESGIAAIIGTGSNTCLFDGKAIVKSLRGLGYILGDEGSGAYLGIKFLKAYLKGEVPSDVGRLFEVEYALDHEAILDRVYTEALPNRFLASFSKFLHRNLGHPFVYDLVHGGVADLFDSRICRYDNFRDHKIRCVGSIAHHFETVLRQVARERGLEIDRVIKYPIDDLVRFHLARR